MFLLSDQSCFIYRPFGNEQKKNVWVDGKQTRKNPIKGGMNLDKEEDEGIFICIFSVIALDLSEPLLLSSVWVHEPGSVRS